MAIAFPLPLADFWQNLKIREARLTVPSAVSVSETQSGEIITVGHGPSLWTGTVTATVDTFVDADVILSQLELLLRPDASFFVTDATRRGPQLDRQGVVFGGSTPKISPRVDRSEVSITGLPSPYTLKPGDLLSFAYGSSPTRYALHRVTKQATATGVGGDITTLNIHPLIQPGLVGADTPVRLVDPFCKAKIIPGSYQPPDFTRARRAAFSFSWRQTLR